MHNAGVRTGLSIPGVARLARGFSRVATWGQEMQKLLIAAAVVAFSSTGALAAGNTSTATGSASAIVVAPLTLTHTAGAALNFGKFTTGAGTVVITPTGGQSATGGVNIVTGGSPAADAFTVAGDSTRTFTIATTNSTVANGATTMAFTTTPSAATGTLVAGAASFTVGGTLTAVGTEGAGTYTGTYSVTVTYN